MRHILIDNSGINPKHCSYGCPWEHDATCYNFRMPDEAIHSSDIDKIDNMKDIESLVIGCDLDNY